MTLTRRQFIVGGLTAAGGVAFGFRLTLLRGPDTPPGVEDLEGEVLNWVVIAPDGTVTIRVAQMEMGQGTTTAMAQLLAEELDVAWPDVRVEFISMRRHIIRGNAYGRTATAGSQGVYLSEQPLREVGARIKAMLLQAAADTLGVPAGELSGQDSLITHGPTGRTLTYGQVAAAAGRMDPAVAAREPVSLKPRRQWRYIGHSIPRLDIPAKTDGTARYGMDVRPSGLLYAAIAMSPVVGGRLLGYQDGEPRQAAPWSGLAKIVSASDFLAVVGDSWWHARRFLDGLSIQWEAPPTGPDSSDAVRANLHRALDDAPTHSWRQSGDVVAAAEGAATVLEADYFVPFAEHAAPEPLNCTARVTDDTFEVWTGTQQPDSAVETAARVAGLPVTSGELHLMEMGGAFGRRQESDYVAQAVHIARQMDGVPVKLIWSREDTTRHGFYRPATAARLRGALDAEGNLLAWSQRIAGPAATFDQGVRTRFGSDTLLYAVPSMKVEAVHRPPVLRGGQIRGVAYATHGFMTQGFMDELAVAAGVDAYYFQRDLLDPARVPPDAPRSEYLPHDIPPSERARRLRAVLDDVAVRSGWGEPLGPLRGRGLAVHEQAQAYYAVVVEVTLDGAGWLRVDRVVVSGDPGVVLNPRNADAQVEGCVAFGLTTALYSEITLRDGRVVEGNLDTYPILRMDEMPRVEVHWMPSGAQDWGGVGEPVTSAVVPALVNAIYDAGGPRLRSLPLRRHDLRPRNGSAQGWAPDGEAAR